jgi:hypothetical protein
MRCNFREMHGIKAKTFPDAGKVFRPGEKTYDYNALWEVTSL